MDFVHKKILPNGLRVLVYPMSWAQSVTCRLLVKAGPRYETDSNAGAAHFLEHMFFEGSKNYPTRRAMDRAIEAKGGEYDAYTDREYVMYQAKLPASNGELAPGFVRELVFNASMEQKALERERGVIAAELRRNMDTPREYVWDLVTAHAWQGHSLGNHTLGTFSSIGKINIPELAAYHKKLYRPDNAILVIVGNISVDRAYEQAAQVFGDLVASGERFSESPAPVFNPKPRVLKEPRKLGQNHILLAFGTCGIGEASDKLGAILVLTKILCNNIFHQFVYNLGLSYSAGAWDVLVTDNGLLVIGVEVLPKKTDTAIEAIWKEVKNLKIDKDLVEEAKAGVISDKILDLADTPDYANFIGEQELYKGSVKSPEEVREEIQNVTIEEVCELAKNILREENCTTVILGTMA